MFFSKPQPTVTPEGQSWLEEAFTWFEAQYGRDYLKKLPVIEPTKKFFNYRFTGVEADALYVLEKYLAFTEIRNART